MVLLGTCLLLDVWTIQGNIRIRCQILGICIGIDVCVPDNGKSELSDITWMCLNHTTGYKN